MSTPAPDSVGSQRPGPRPAGAAVSGQSELGGDLRCRRCGYNLRGLSIRSVCSECGLPVRATLLAVVDPRAKELQTIHFPRLTGVGLLVWTHAAFLCAISIAVSRASFFGLLPRADFLAGHWPAAIIGALAVLSTLASLVLVAPHGGLSVKEKLLALCGVICAAGVAVCLHQIHAHIDPTIPPGAGDINPRTDRTLWKLLADSSLLASLLLLRPNARLLAARSLLMRTGQVNRQTLASLAAVVGVCIVGDLLLLAAGAEWSTGGLESAARWTGQIFVLVGSALLLAGFIGAAVDTWRLLPVVLERPLHIDDLVPAEEQR